jgi:NAD(P)-dependent dehydrogenase (short-subunit alcohol dehydrogenase family)
MNVLVTGASGTIGRAICESLARDGHSIISAGRGRARAGMDHLRLDLGVERSCTRIRQTPIGGLVLAAGLDSYLGASNYRTELVLDLLRVNAVAQVELATRLSRTRARILRLAALSSSVLQSREQQSLAYCMSKAALEEGLTQLAVERANVAVLLVRSCFVGTRMASRIERTSRELRRSGRPPSTPWLWTLRRFFAAPRVRTGVHRWP